MKTYTLLVVILLGSIQTLCNTKKMASGTKISITKETVTKLTKTQKKKFDAFLEQKKKEYEQLMKWTPNNFLGKIATFAIETFSPLMGLGDVDVRHAKTFLGRAFEKEEKLKKAITKLDEDQNIRYLQTVFSDQITNRPDLIQAIRKHRHPCLTNEDLKKMGDKNDKNQYIISDDIFYTLASCNFAAFHIFEQTTAQKRQASMAKNNRKQINTTIT